MFLIVKLVEILTSENPENSSNNFSKIKTSQIFHFCNVHQYTEFQV